MWRQAHRECLRGRTIAVALVSVVLFVVAMTVFGPLDTSATFAPLRRLLYWAMCAGVSFPACYATAAMVLYLMRSRSLVETVPAILSGVLFEGLICTAVVHTADTLCRPDYAGSVSLPSIYGTVTIVLAVCTFFVHYVIFQRVAHAPQPGPQPAVPRARAQVAAGAGNAATGAGASAAAQAARSGGPGASTARATERRPQAPGVGVAPPVRDQGRPAGPGRGDPPAAPRPAATAPARFLRRLPSRIGHDVIYLKVDDHYIDVYTTVDHAVILMRFADAVAELSDFGMQVHRSYWVARRHVTELVSKEGRELLRLTGGHLVPVSRTYRSAVRSSFSV